MNRKHTCALRPRTLHLYISLQSELQNVEPKTEVAGSRVLPDTEIDLPHSTTKETIHRLRSHDMSRAVGGQTAGHHSDLHWAPCGTATQGGQCFIHLRGQLFRAKQKNSRYGVLEASVSNANECCLTNAATSDGTNPHLTAEQQSGIFESAAGQTVLVCKSVASIAGWQRKETLFCRPEGMFGADII